MHRHAYQGRKFHRERDQRAALIKGLADSLIKYGSIETTLPKAKELRPFVERLITKAKKGDLHNRRQIIADLQTKQSANKLVDEVAPKLKGRSSGHLKIERTRLRRGDNAQLARISFVDSLANPEDSQLPVVSEQSSVEKAPVAKQQTTDNRPQKTAPKEEAK